MALYQQAGPVAWVSFSGSPAQSVARPGRLAAQEQRSFAGHSQSASSATSTSSSAIPFLLAGALVLKAAKDRRQRSKKMSLAAAVVASDGSEAVKSRMMEAQRFYDRVLKQNAQRTRARVVLPTILCGVTAWFLFPAFHWFARNMLLCTWVAGREPAFIGDLGLEIVYQGFVSQFLAVFGLLFSILGGSSYASLYGQNESIYLAIFAEVSEAKALVEQLVLVCQGRPILKRVLSYVQRYVRQDLRRIDVPPSVLLANRPRDDPLESILYSTSVGVPSSVYETVKSLRAIRGQRLGAIQRKLPPIQIALLYVLGGCLVLGFPFLSAEVDRAGSSPLLRLLFSLLAAAVVMTMRVINELWNPTGGAYNVDGVLQCAIRGLEEEISERMEGKAFSNTQLPPPPVWRAKPLPDVEEPEALQS